MAVFLKNLAANALVKGLGGSLRDLMPIVVVIAVFQLLVLKTPIPNLGDIVMGLLLVVVGLTLFIRGLEYALFPIGESLAHALARRGSVPWLLIFAFSLGLSTTIAEPALIAVAMEAASTAADAGIISSTQDGMETYALSLRLTVAFAVGFAVVLGVLRIIKGWPLHYMIIGGYLLVVALSKIAPAAIIGIAFDTGGVTTSTVTVPLVTALGVGLATAIRGRSPLTDGFGLIAFASLTPMIFVLIFGVVMFGMGG